MTTYQRQLLQLIANNSNRWSWYTLHFEIIKAKIPPDEDLMGAIQALIRLGYIQGNESGNPSMPIYAITIAGQEFLKEKTL